MDMDAKPHQTYEDAPQALIRQWEARRRPMGFGPGEGLPRAADLEALAAQTVPMELPPLPSQAGRHAAKEQELAPEFAGQPALWLTHALTISHLRKAQAPRGANRLFRLLWTRHQALMLALPSRWLISAAITFADHGVTESERRLGAELNILFSMLKLTEFERLFSGVPPTQAFQPRHRSKAPLPLGMEPFSFLSGGLDVNLLAPLWQRAEGESVLGPIALELFRRLNADPGNIFARIEWMRGRKRAHRRKLDEGDPIL